MMEFEWLRKQVLEALKLSVFRYETADGVPVEGDLPVKVSFEDYSDGYLMLVFPETQELVWVRRDEKGFFVHVGGKKYWI